MKVVINKCFGGFGLSNAAVLELIRKGSKIVTTYESGRPKPDNFDPNGYFLKKYEGRQPYADGYLQDEPGSLSWGTLYKDDLAYHVDDSELKRDHPDLIWVVEKLGAEVNGDCAKLEIVEIPDGVEYAIDEYDGKEHIAEAHRTWG